MAKISAMTVDELFALLLKAHKAGLGGKHILLSDDDEGNGYHELFFGLTPPEEGMFDYCGLPFGLSEKEVMEKYVILG